MTDAQWQEYSGPVVTEVEVFPAVNREGGRGLVLRLTVESPSGHEELIFDGGLSAETAVSIGETLQQMGTALLGRPH